MRIAGVLAAGLCLVGISVAPARAEDFSKGLEVGFSESKISPSPNGVTVSYSPGVLAGGYIFIPWKRAISFQVEAVYAQKHSSAQVGSTTSNLKLDYIEVPLLVKMPMFKGIYMLEGVGLAFPIRAQVETGSTTVDNKSNTTSPDVTLIIAGGHQIHNNWFLEGRYDGGLRSTDSTGVTVARTRSFAIIARVKL
jgi:hypothetical protein